MSDIKVLPISVVIPSLGGPTLQSCLHHIFHGSSIPAEVIVCLPPNFPISSVSSAHQAVRFVVSPASGQVHQRAFGFIQSTSPYVLQLDDDINLQSDALVSLFSAAQQSTTASAYGPIFIDIDSGDDWHSIPSGFIGFLENLYQTFVHFLPWGVNRMGKVSLSGFCWGVDPSRLNGEAYPVQWLAGGCVLTARNNLISNTPNLFPGKAFSEDLYFSFLRRRQGCSQYILPYAHAFTLREPRSFNLTSFGLEYMTRTRVVRRTRCSVLLFTYGFIVDIFRTGASSLILLISRLSSNHS